MQAYTSLDYNIEKKVSVAICHDKLKNFYLYIRLQDPITSVLRDLLSYSVLQWCSGLA